MTREEVRGLVYLSPLIFMVVWVVGFGGWQFYQWAREPATYRERMQKAEEQRVSPIYWDGVERDQTVATVATMETYIVDLAYRNSTPEYFVEMVASYRDRIERTKCGSYDETTISNDDYDIELPAIEDVLMADETHLEFEVVFVGVDGSEISRLEFGCPVRD